MHCCTLPDKWCLSHSMCLYQVMMTLHFLNDVANDAESIQIENYVIIASLKSGTMGKLINRIPGSCLLIPSLLGSALRTHVLRSVLKALPGKLDIKRHSSSILYFKLEFAVMNPLHGFIIATLIR